MALLQIHEPGATPAPHSDDEGAGGVSVGIDLGTTHSLVAYGVVGQDADAGGGGGEQMGVEVIRDRQGRVLLPSALAFDQGGIVAVGYEALAFLSAEETSSDAMEVVTSIKRFMGRSRDDSDLGILRSYAIESDDKGMLCFRLGGKTHTPVSLSALILKALRERAERAIGHAVTKAVITVPAYFDDAARTATRAAAGLAGLQVLRLVNEPTAAALAYGLDSGNEGVYAVYDFGGGTFDFSLLRLRKGVFQVLATGGDCALGGDDCDAALLAWARRVGLEQDAR